VPLERGLVLEDPVSGWAGAVVRLEAGLVELEDWKGRTRSFPATGQFLLEGELVRLGRPGAPIGGRGSTSGGARGTAPLRPGGAAATTGATSGRARTASGSFAVEQQRARVARPSRIMVEGRHDAELVEKVWGADLRVEGVVVEYLSGVDNLAEVLEDATCSSWGTPTSTCGSR
jgi:hypothetical protein